MVPRSDQPSRPAAAAYFLPLRGSQTRKPPCKDRPATTTSARGAAREQARAPAARSTGRGRLRLYRRVRRRLGGDVLLRPYLRFSSSREMPPAALYPAHERLIRSMKSGLWLKEKVSKSRPRRIGTTAATGFPRPVSTQVSLAVFRPYSAREASVISTVFMVRCP